ncbi:MAG: PadR family transcriptional regulator [Gemmatimonadetes bacterium]|nr:PadR family transcriptional regulator [Gemmatimonadota bacterium]
MAGRHFLGELEELVLLASLRLGDEAYGASVLRLLDEHTGRDVPRGSVYVAIDRLAKKGFIRLHRAPATPARRGRPRRMITVTSGGVQALRRTLSVRERLLDGLAPIGA